MEFDVFTTTVDLQDIPSYTTSITLEGQLLRLSLLWNERIGKRTMFITNSVGECYLQNTILHPNESFELNSNAVFDDLPYKVVLQKTGDTNRVGNLYTWSKDFILVFYRTIDVETTPLNVRYGVNVPSTPTLPRPFRDWTLNQGFTLIGDDIRYTGYKTDQVTYYDSFADFDLVTALVRSFQDSDMQTWQGFINAVDELTDGGNWILDLTNNQIIKEPTEDEVDKYSSQYIWHNNSPKFAYSARDYCNLLSPSIIDVIITPYNGQVYFTCVTGYTASGDPTGPGGGMRYANPNYNPDYNPNAVATIPLETVAQKVISNAVGVDADEMIQMFAETYIQEVTNSIFNTNLEKQFVKLSDLIPQLEANKVLRD